MKLGEKHTPESRAHLSAVRMGMKFTDEHRANLSAAHKGHKASAETRAKMSAGQRNRKPPSEETRAKIGAAHRGLVYPAEVRARMGSPRMGTEIRYEAAHNRADRVLPRVCAMEDETCKGLLDAALTRDVPVEFVRRSPKGLLYYVGPDPRDGYRRLCRSHHVRYDRG